MEYGCIGEHLSHSFSAEIHKLIGSYKYEICEIPEGELDSFMLEKDFLGINVTIPYKERVMPYLDFISEDALKIGAVNTIVNKNGKLFGYNTDFFGMSALIKRTGVDISGKKVLIAGTGGTSKTAKAVSESLGCREAVRLSRNPHSGYEEYDRAGENHPDTALIINTTPLGMFPNEEGTLPLRLKDFPSLEGVVDAVYNPLRTNFISEAARLGLPAQSGLYMLVAQAVAASEIFFDTKYPQTLTEDIFTKIRQSKGNIVLVGMPGSGKTTAGKIIAQRLGKGFVDTDEMIVKKAGMEIPEIFKQLGEKSFRDMESEVIKDISQKKGLVISTGGGAVLRKENVSRLQRNGRIYFLDRPPKKEKPDGSRPLLTDENSVFRLYSERIDIYRSASDITVNIKDGDIEDTVRCVTGDFTK